MPIASLTAGIGTSDPQATASVTATSGGIVLVTVSLAITDPADPLDNMTISGLGGTWVKLATVNYGTRRRAWLFQGENCSGTGTISFDYLGGGTVQEWGWTVDQVTNQDGTTPTFGVASATGDSTSRVITSGGTPGAGDFTYTSLCLESNIDCTLEDGWSPLGQTTTGSLGVRRIESAWDDAADVSHSWAWDGTLQGNAAFILIVKAGVTQPTITYVGASPAWAAGSTSITPAMASGWAAGDKLLTVIHCKPASTGTPPTIGTPTGWTLVQAPTQLGTAAQGVDTGAVWQAVYERIAVAGDTAPAYTITNGNVSLGLMLALRKTGSAWGATTTTTGADTTSNTTFNVTGAANLSFNANDYAIVLSGLAGNTTQSAGALTATASTFGTLAETVEGDTTTGNDLAASVWHASVTGGPSSAAPVFSATLVTARIGGATFIRVRLGEAQSLTRDFSVTGVASVNLLKVAGFQKAFSLLGAATTPLIQVKQLVRAYSLVGNSTVGFVQAKSLARSYSITSVGTGILAKLSSWSKLLTSTGVSNVGFTSLKSRAVNLQANGTSLGSLAKTISFLRTASVTGVQQAAIAKQSAFTRNFNASGTASIALARVLTAARNISVLGTASTLFTRASTLARSFSNTGIGAATVTHVGGVIPPRVTRVRAIRSTQTSPNTGSVRDLTSFGVATTSPNTATAAVLTVTDASRRFLPNNATGTSAAPPTVGTATSNQGWRDTEPQNANEQIRYLDGTWIVRTKIRKTGQTLPADVTVRITWILYQVTSAGAFVAEVMRGVSANTVLSATDLDVVSSVSASAFTINAGDKLQAEIYVQNIDALGNVTPPAATYNVILLLDQDEPNTGTAFTSQPLYQILYARSFSISSISAVVFTRFLNLQRLLSVTGNSTVDFIRTLSLFKSASTIGAGTVSFLRASVFQRIFSVSSTVTTSFARLVAYQRSHTVTGTGTGVLAKNLVLHRFAQATGSAVAIATKVLSFNRIHSVTGSATVLIRRHIARNPLVATGLHSISLQRSITYFRSIEVFSFSVVAIEIVLARSFEVIGTSLVTFSRSINFARHLSATGAGLGYWFIQLGQALWNRIIQTGGGGGTDVFKVVDEIQVEVLTPFYTSTTLTEFYEVAILEPEFMVEVVTDQVGGDILSDTIESDLI